MTNPVFAILLSISGLISGTIALVAWRRRPAAGTVPLAATMASMALWGWMYAITWLTPDASVKFFWLGLAFIGVVVSSPTFLIMAIEFTGSQHWLTRKFYIAIFALPLIGMLMYITDPWFDLFYGGANFADPGDLMRGGLGFLLLAVNGYICTFGAIFLFVRHYFRTTAVKRSSILIILLGTSFPMIGTIISILQLSPFPGLDLTPLVFTFSGVLYAQGLLSYQMMDLAPIGRDAVLEKMEEGMLIVDDLDRVVDINPSASSFLNEGIQNPIGKTITKVFSEWAEIAGFDLSAPSGKFQVQTEEPEARYFKVLVTPLSDSKDEKAGRLFMWHDVTTQKLSEAQILEANTNLTQQLEEIEKLQGQLHEMAIRDSLTGLFNRRFLEEIAKREFPRAERENIPLSFVMFDIDNFKMVNDTYGHVAGDQVLEELGEVFLKYTREGDFVFRYGGDELLVIMPDTPYEDALRRAEELAQRFSELSFDFKGAVYQTTLSMGAATYPAHAKSVDELLLAADRALYSVKNKRDT